MVRDRLGAPESTPQGTGDMSAVFAVTSDDGTGQTHAVAVPPLLFEHLTARHACLRRNRQAERPHEAHHSPQQVVGWQLWLAGGKFHFDKRLHLGDVLRFEVLIFKPCGKTLAFLPTQLLLLVNPRLVLG